MKQKLFVPFIKGYRTFPGFTALKCPWRILAFVRLNNIDTELRYLFRVVSILQKVTNLLVQIIQLKLKFHRQACFCSTCQQQQLLIVAALVSY